VFKCVVQATEGFCSQATICICQSKNYKAMCKLIFEGLKHLVHHLR